MKPLDVRQIASGARRLPKLQAPREVTSRLLVMASREAARRRRLRSPRALFEYFRSEVRLRVDNVMKPVALPVAGGFVSALLLFAMLVPSLLVQHAIVGDVPTNLTTRASLASSISFAVSDDEIVVDVSIDEYGRVSSYSIPAGQGWAEDPILVRSIENTLLMTRFTPATLFGQPASGRTRITLRRSQVEVRG
jgi:hypothetical protein